MLEKVRFESTGTFEYMILHNFVYKEGLKDIYFSTNTTII